MYVEICQQASWTASCYSHACCHAAQVPLWDMHKTGECTHWCSPSAYHVWLYLLNGLLRDRGLGNAAPDGATFEPL